MRPRSLSASLLLGGLLGVLAQAQAAARDTAPRAWVDGTAVTLANARCQLKVDTRTGAIVSLTPGPGSLRGPWFEVVAEGRAGLQPWETWRRGPETLFTGGPARTVCRREAGAATITLTWRRPGGLVVVAEVRLRRADSGPTVRLTVVNTTGAALVDTVRMPVLRGVALGDGGDDWFTWPHTLGARLRVQGLRPGETLEQPYPGFLTMQWLDLHDDRQGVYVGCLDDYGFSKTLSIGRDRDGRSMMAVTFGGCWVARKGDRWTTPWVQIAAHQGDWRAGADLYRPFAQRSLGPLRAPERLREMPTAQCWLAHHASDGDVGRLFEVQQQAPIHASYVMKSVNTSTPEGWDGLRGSALEYERAFRRIRALGGSPALFVFDRAPNMGRPNYAEHVGRWLCRRRDGSFEEGFRDLMPSPFDPGFVRARVGEAVRWVRSFGIDEIHYDTEATAGAGMLAGPDYSLVGGRRPNEVPHYFRRLYRATVAACRRWNPDFTLRAEHLADFWFPEFAAGTAHFYSTATGTLVLAHNPPRDAQLMPLLFRYTLPRHAAFEIPSVAASDLWPYGYGMGHGFHGGGPSWCFNPGVRDAESPAGELLHRYRFYDLDWRRFYDFRVGFEEAVVDAEGSDVRAEALIGGRWVRCDFPGPVVAVTSRGGGREVTLGQWFPQDDTSAFGRELVGRAALKPRPILLRVSTRLARPHVRLYGPDGELPCAAVVRGGRVQVRVADPSCFALEVATGPTLRLALPPLAHPGAAARVTLAVSQDTPAPGRVTLRLPAGWPKLPAFALPASRRYARSVTVRVPKGLFGRNYPIKAVLTSGRFRRTVAAHLKVMEPFTVLYSFEAETGGVAGATHAVDAGKPARLTITCVNNTPRAADVVVSVSGEQVRGREAARLAGIAPHDLGRPGGALDRWMEGQGPAPSNVCVRSFRFDCRGVPRQAVRVRVATGAAEVFAADAFPRTRVMDLSGPWQARLSPVSRATVGGAERLDTVDTEAVTPDVWDGGWQTVQAPVTFDERTHQDNAWGIYRRLVFVPAAWQGADVWLRLGRMGAPWGAGGTLNLVYVNGWPSGRIGASGECTVSPFLVFGGWNLIAVASASPSSLIGPYLFVRRAPAPERLRAAEAGPRPRAAFLVLGPRCTGQGLTMPFIQGIAEDDHRRTDLAAGGESQFLYFAVADAYLREPRAPVEVAVEYLDQGSSPFGLDYDSTDPSAPVGGAFKAAEPARRTGSGQWRTHVFTLTDARLANREHMGSDFRLYGVKEDLRVRRVEVRPAGGGP